MKYSTSANKKTFGSLGWLPLLLVFAMAIAIVIYIVSAGNDGNKYTVVKLDGTGDSYNLSKLYFVSSAEADSLRSNALLAEKGDLLLLDEIPYYFDDVKQDSLHFENKNGDSLLYLNGKLNTIIISEDVDLLPWFNQMKDADIPALQTLVVDADITDSCFTYIQKIAKIKPHLCLALTADDSLVSARNFEKLVNIFSPKVLVTKFRQKQLDLLARWRDLECIYINIEDSIVTKSLPALPLLRQIIILPDNGNVISDNFLSNNPQIEKLTAFGQAFPYIKELNNLDVLNLNSFDSLDLNSITTQCKNLTSLNLGGEYCTNIASLDSLKQLTWLGLPEEVSQQEFDNILLHHKNLQVLEMRGNKEVKSLQPVTQLPELRGLIITDTVMDNKTLYALKQLRYLSLPEENFKDSTNMLSLQKALPGCIIVPNSGACLGSGWLLLIIPFILVFAFVLHFFTGKPPLPVHPNDKIL